MERTLIVSDTHGKIDNLKIVLERIGHIDRMIHLGDGEGLEYAIENLTAPYGYDLRYEDYEFSVDEGRDWDDPIVISIPFSPSTNVITIQMNDSKTKDAVTGGSYYVVAAEDIITLDGTLRYRSGEVVDEIVCDEYGYGESKELYLGNYELKENLIPEYYAGDTDVIPVEVVQKNSDTLPNPEQIWCEKTAFTITLCDELYPDEVVEDGQFEVAYYLDTDMVDTYETGSLGTFTVTDLTKNTTYSVHQTVTADGYTLCKDVIEISVDAIGRIENEATRTYTVNNRIIRTKFQLKDMVLGGQVSDMNLTLYNESGEVVSGWDTSGIANTIEGISPGNYYLLINGRESGRQDIQVTDTAEVQNFTLRVWTVKGIIAVVAAIFFLLVLLVLLIWLLIRTKEERRRKREERREARKVNRQRENGK